MSPKIRQTIYQLGTIIPAVLGIALVWGGIDDGAANSIAQIITGLVSLLGAGAPAIAATKVSQQTKDGTFDDVSPADAVVNGVQAVIQAQADASAELDKVKQAVTNAVGVIPGMGPLAAQIINNLPIPFAGAPTAYSNFSDLQQPWNRP
jgi:hypothetical protein